MACTSGSEHAALTAAASQTLQSFLDSNLAAGSSVFETCSSVSFAKALAGAVRCVLYASFIGLSLSSHSDMEVRMSVSAHRHQAMSNV